MAVTVRLDGVLPLFGLTNSHPAVELVAPARNEMGVPSVLVRAICVFWVAPGFTVNLRLFEEMFSSGAVLVFSVTGIERLFPPGLATTMVPVHCTLAPTPRGFTETVRLAGVEPEVGVTLSQEPLQLAA